MAPLCFSCKKLDCTDAQMMFVYFANCFLFLFGFYWLLCKFLGGNLLDFSKAILTKYSTEVYLILSREGVKMSFIRLLFPQNKMSQSQFSYCCVLKPCVCVSFSFSRPLFGHVQVCRRWISSLLWHRNWHWTWYTVFFRMSSLGIKLVLLHLTRLKIHPKMR